MTTQHSGSAEATVVLPHASGQKAEREAVAIVSDGLLTIEQTCAFLGLSRGAVYKLMEAGRLPFVKLGRSRRIPRRSVVELAARSLQGGECR